MASWRSAFRQAPPGAPALEATALYRKDTGDVASRCALDETLTLRGYRFVGPVVRRFGTCASTRRMAEIWTDRFASSTTTPGHAASTIAAAARRTPRRSLHKIACRPRGGAGLSSRLNFFGDLQDFRRHSSSRKRRSLRVGRRPTRISAR